MKILRRAFLFLGFLLLLLVIHFVLPVVYNPSPSYQTADNYGDPLPVTIQDILTPNEKPDRVRSIMVMQGENVVYEYGPTDKIMNGHSTRKSFLSLLYGIAINKGLIDLDKTLAALGIDENPPLTDQEKTATIKDLLLFKSGIYLPAAGEHDSQITDRPVRESHKPGTYYFSNNFDANALGTIFIQETGSSIGAFMEEHLAKPLGMQDFDADNVVMGPPWFWPKGESIHEMYYMHLSTRDFARIGAMVANNGRWNGVQVVPEDWIKESTAAHTVVDSNHISYGRYNAFGYIWSLDQKNKTIWTDGYGGHFMLIDPIRNLTLVDRNFTGNSHLSTGMWIMSDWKDNGPHELVEAHKLLTQK